MEERDVQMEKFGPKLIEALALVTLDEINILREAAGLAPRTSIQLLKAVGTQLDSLPDYNWMSKLIQEE